MPEKLKMHTPDHTAQNIQKLAELFPDCVTEIRDEAGKVTQGIDFDQLRQELSGVLVEGPRERYHLDWPGKREAILAANAPIAKTLRPSRNESVNFDTTKNLFIEGDNLDALKLLQETYLGKVKLIYIDPPYNTGNDFIYEDDFAQDSESYLSRSNQEDTEGNRLVANNESNGRFHSDWLSMIYPRLKLARNLLRDDGVLFISIDDNEQANLKRLCDEVLGAENCVGVVVKKSKLTSNGGEFFSPSHEYLLTYARSIENLPGFSDPESQEDEDYLKLFKFEDEYSKYNIVGLYQPSLTLERSRNARYYITCPDGSKCIPPEGKRWRVVQPSYFEMLQKNLIVFKETSTSPLRDDAGAQSRWNIYTKIYLKDRLVSGMRPVTFLDRYPNSEASKELIRMKIPFDFSKPKRMIMWLLKICGARDGDIILDFFAGSGTTGHAVLDYNREVNTQCKFILVQMPEACPPNTDAAKGGFNTIAEIARERIRRAGLHAGEKNSSLQLHAEDLGFRAFRIDTSNMLDVYYTPDAVTQEDLLGQVDNIRLMRSPEDLLFQVLVDWGLDLALPIAEETIEGKQVFFVDQNALAASFDTGVTDEMVKAIAQRKPLRAVFRDSSYGTDSVKINVEQIFKLLSPETEVRSI
jgi:adenine-specific DNA-methyltransferase